MARALPLPIQTMYAELVERCGVALLAQDFPLSGGFVSQTTKGRQYWYFQARHDDGRRRQRYVGPDSPELRRRIEAHNTAKDDFRERRQMVSALRRAGLPGTDPLTGRVLRALAEAGVFRLRAVVVGTVAYQTYSGLLGVRLGGTATMTADLDIAQFPSNAVATQDAIALPFEDILKGVDRDFHALPYSFDPRHATRYALGDRYRVDILAPNRGPESDAPVPLPAIKAEGQPLRYLDFLIHQEVQAVTLAEGGILINVPAPERYALHKLIVSRLRLETKEAQTKAQKDLRQAAALLPVLAEQRPFELEELWHEMLKRGPKWKQHAKEAVQLLPGDARQALERATNDRRKR
jgi:hypothetical protein